MTGLFKLAAPIMAATLAFMACNKDNSVYEDNAPAMAQVMYDFSSFDLATRSLPSTFSTVLNFDYFTFSPTDAEWTANPYVKKWSTGDPTLALISIKDGQPSASNLWLSPGQRIGGIMHSALITPIYDNKSGIEEVFYSGGDGWATADIPLYQLYYSGVVDASYDKPSITAQLSPVFSSYDFSDITITCANPNLHVETTADITYTVPSRWKLKPVDGAVKTTLISESLSIVWADKNSADGVKVLKSTTDADKLTYSSPTPNTSVVFLPAVRQARVSFNVKVLDSNNAVVGSKTFSKTYDMTPYNAELTAYKFKIVGTVNAGGGPITYDMSVSELPVVNADAFDVGTIVTK